MSRIFAALVTIALGTGAHPAESKKKSERPVVVVDEAHQHAGGNEKPLIYELAPSAGFIIDASTYHFELPAELGGGELNSIQLVLGPGEMFTVPWVRGKTRYVISSETARAVSGNRVFGGLPAGRRVAIAIGITRKATADFDVVWASLIDVKKP